MINVSPTTEYERYEVSAGYIIYIRVATVKFKV
jgi:hypothetical protein